MPRPKAERLAESLWQRHKPDILAMLDMALAEAEGQGCGPGGADAEDAEARYIAERAAAQLARHRGKATGPRNKTQ